MKLIRLEIKNLASLDREEGEVIDFENGVLGASDIFSIVGPTGSGKSTILDAICLPLYNRTPRYRRQANERKSQYQVFGNDDDSKNRISRYDGRNILSRGKKEGWSKLTFLANDGRVYRAEWSVTFRRVNFDKAHTALYTFSEEGEEIPCDWNTLPEIIGLDFNQFLRTVLIAQGSFAEFLNSEENDRMLLLERLTGADSKFSRLAEGVAEGKKKASEELAAIDGRLKAFAADDLTPEAYDALASEIERLTKESAAVAAATKKVEEEMKWYEAAETLTKRLDQTTSRHQKAMEALQSKATEAQTLALYDATSELRRLYSDRKKRIEEAGEAEKEEAKIEKELNELSGRIETAVGKAKADRQRLVDSRNESEKCAPIIRKAMDLKVALSVTARSLCEQKEQLVLATSALSTAHKAAEKNSEEIERLNKKIGVKKGEAESLRKKQQQKEKEFEETLAEKEIILKQLEESLTAIDPVKVRKEKDRLAAEITNLKETVRLREESSKLSGRIDVRREQLRSLTLRNEEIEKQLKGMDAGKFERELDTLREAFLLITGEQWELHRSKLHDGEPCPLCGALEHPYADSERFIPVVTKMDGLVKQKTKELEEMRSLERTLRDELSANAGQSVTLRKELQEDEKASEIAEASLSRLKENQQSLPEDIPTLRELVERLEGEEKKTSELLKEIDSRRQSHDVAVKERDTVMNEFSVWKKEAQKLSESMEKTLGELRESLSAANARTEGLTLDVEEKEKSCRELNDKIKEISRSISEREEQIKSLTEGKDPEEREKELASNVRKQEQIYEKSQQTLTTLREQQKKGEGSREQLRQRRNLLQNECEALAASFSISLSKFNRQRQNDVHLDEHGLRQLVEASTEWEKLRVELTSLRDELTAAAATMESEKAALGRHEENRPSEPLESLRETEKRLSAYDASPLEQAKIRKAACDEARKKMGDSRLEREQALSLLTDWKEIQEAIGADGMRVRKIAQCYTLGFLIDHANAEIRRFNRRYELIQVKNSLDIRVIDHERGGDVRDTTSLSGGESFIVSLGLALGLSALSSRNVAFDNLFIDEGFGSLDAETLATVIESLSMLQSSRGKKVGVISHTDLMSERIPTQIRVERSGVGGSSRLRIVS